MMLRNPGERTLAALCHSSASCGRAGNESNMWTPTWNLPMHRNHLSGRPRQPSGHIDILIVNHAHAAPGCLEEVTADQIDRHLHVNVRASLLLAKAFAAQHDGRPGGCIVLLTSGRHVAPMPGELAYAASKGALHQITRSLSAHLAPRRITVNAVNPGATDTGYAPSPLYREVLALEPQGRWGEPADAARIIGWLVTDDAQWITGEVINSTGGGP